MKFGPVPLAQAKGAILAHATAAVDGDDPNGGARRIPKGTVLTDAHVRALANAGVASVIAARLEPGDVAEDAAARRLARAAMGAGLAAGDAGTGRVNLRATHPGIVELDAAAIDAANRVDAGITLATVAPWTRMGRGGLAATIKIIPFAVPEAALVRACDLVAAAVALRPPTVAAATLIETRVGPDVPPDKGRRAMAGRLGQLDVALGDRVVVPHDADAVADALRAAPGTLRLILTGSATCDIRDVAPEGLRRAGGEVLHYGMPVDPGNLLFLGRLGDDAVIGLPGCARSPALNGADWVLERVICGLSPARIDIPGMGVGGLLKEIPSRPSPRDR